MLGCASQARILIRSINISNTPLYNTWGLPVIVWLVLAMQRSDDARLGPMDRIIRADCEDRLVELVQRNKLVMDDEFPGTALSVTHQHHDIAVQAEHVRDRNP